jgi:hypothetical protein
MARIGLHIRSFTWSLKTLTTSSPVLAKLNCVMVLTTKYQHQALGKANSWMGLVYE